METILIKMVTVKTIKILYKFMYNKRINYLFLLED
jgi:hypothetical protein